MDEKNVSWLLRPKFGKSVYYPMDYTRSSTVEFPALARGALRQHSLSGDMKRVAFNVPVSRPIRSTNKTTVLPQPGYSASVGLNHKGMMTSSEVAVSPKETIGTLTSETHVPADDKDSDATEVTPTQVVTEVEETSPTNTLSKKEANGIKKSPNGKSVTQKIKKFILPRACVSSPKVRD